ncbi:MAG TPA: hypothetical protein PKA27_10635 [Fimbriimonadaceae bacterium]|nr:hypothetical protein [Fimbriimonadaceae bacterium]
MKLLSTVLCTLAFAVSSLAAIQEPTVSVNSKGDDVRSVLHGLFEQAKKNYVLEPGVRFVLYLSLKDVDLEEALGLICAQANLSYEIQNGIYFVNRVKAVEQKPAVKQPAKPKGKLPETVLNSKVTTRLAKTDLRAVFSELGKQSKITIEVAADVPGYKLDAFLIDTSLRYALDNITKATGLVYVFTDNQTIAIKKPENPNRVNVYKD